MRSLALTTLASLLLSACGDNGDMQITLTPQTTGGSTENVSVSSDPGTTSNQTTAPNTTTDATTGDALTTEPVTTGPTTTGPDPTGPDPTATDATTTAATTDNTTGGDQGLMSHYGAPCETDADCMELLGATGVCLKDILGVYALPGGYCSTYCKLPDQQTTYILDAPDCTMMADCLGLMGYFEGCAHVCTDDAQCPREGYECRQMPQISNPDDPEFCLMTEDNMIPP
jgi:hypothetical protein